MSMRGGRLTVAVAIAALAALTAPAVAAAGGPTQLWYRISASATGTYDRPSPFTNPSLKQLAASASWSMRSNTAVLVYSRCLPDSTRLTSRELARIPFGTDCATARRQLRLSARAAPTRRAERQLRTLLRKLRRPGMLRPDLRFRANVTGSIGSYRIDTVTPYFEGPVDCPDIFDRRVLTTAAQGTGAISALSAYESGITAGLARTTEPGLGVQAYHADDCVHPVTGNLFRMGFDVTREVGFDVRVLAMRDSELQAGNMWALRDIRLRGIGRKFGRSFTISGTRTEQPSRVIGGHRYVGTATLDYRVRFRLCPRGGRDVRSC